MLFHGMHAKNGYLCFYIEADEGIAKTRAKKLEAESYIVNVDKWRANTRQEYHWYVFGKMKPVNMVWSKPRVKKTDEEMAEEEAQQKEPAE